MKTIGKIKSYWQYETGKFDPSTNKFIDKKLSFIREKELDIILKGKEPKQIIEFSGGPTGFESYYLSDLLNKKHNKFQKDDPFYICAGTINSWARCWVNYGDFLEVLKTINS